MAYFRPGPVLRAIHRFGDSPRCQTVFLGLINLAQDEILRSVNH